MPDPIPLHRAKPRLVRPAPPEIRRKADLDDWLASRREPGRAAVWSRRIGAFAIALSGFVAIYFLFQLGRGVL